MSFFTKLKIRFISDFRALWLALKGIHFYFENTDFAKTDFLLWRCYLGKKIYRLVRDPYGETPLTTFEALAKECGLSEKDTLFELGCGRGRIAFFARLHFGCSVIAVDREELFIKIARYIQKRRNINRMQFLLGDYTQIDLREATHIFFYGTCTPDEVVEKLTEKIAMLSKGTVVFSVSFPLDHPALETIKIVPASFIWGDSEIYIQKITNI